MAARILLADDHPLMRRGLRHVIEREPDLEVVAEAKDGAEAIKLARKHQVDLAILDVAMPRLTGLQVAEQLTKSQPGTKVLLLSMYDNDQYVLAAARAGASGYLLKSNADEDVVAACRAVLHGKRYFDSHLHLSGKAEAAEALTPRELEVLKLISEGATSRQIADSLVISMKTVERHRSNIMNKLDIRDRVQLTRYAIRRGLVEP